jgi:hypothetical protein
MGWEGLERIEEVDPLSTSDRQVLDEVRAVLARHGALQRFGVTLLHSHFDLEPDEVLVEKVELSSRTITIQPLHADDLEGTLQGTTFRLDGEVLEPMMVLYCHRPPNSEHHAR